ncbi:hypothetical protein SAOR_06095 [Salinisphaera orenii MK-B5]|uniref:Uncharacterized protein n=2 Tax=Salinisphaera orenii TaxID=856731 RepID=A0A423PSF4_9GAMM|nr:hypothetical protein SAOR_06095 [Salinisphaera orenii MK-B5]ROO30912.1 hypothetical protein SAHL_07435 [Salinisphaera halophila YIM 95161]
MTAAGPRAVSNFALYMLGVVVVAGALACGAYMLSVPPGWIGVGAAVIVGFGLMGAVGRTRPPRDRR